MSALPKKKLAAQKVAAATAKAKSKLQPSADELVDDTLERLHDDSQLIRKGCLTSRHGIRLLLVTRALVRCVFWTAMAPGAVMFISGLCSVVAANKPDHRSEIVGGGQVASAALGMAAALWLLPTSWAYVVEKVQWDNLKDLPATALPV